MLRLFAGPVLGILAAAAVLGPADQPSSVNEIRLQLDPNELTRALALNDKYDFTRSVALVNGSGPFPAELNIRGQRCLQADRKCFGLKLSQPVALHGDSEFGSRNLNLVSMWRDQGYISCKIGFEMFRALGLFDLRTEYSELFVNDVSQGLYLVTEKPKGAIARESPGAFVGRRRAGASFEVVGRAPKEALHPNAEYVAALEGLYGDVRALRGQALKARIDERLDLNSYLSWLIVNSLLTNGDYSDEVYFYADTRNRCIHFGILPWDLDDLFKAPHPLATNHRYAHEIASGLLYSYEDPLDEKIGTDPVLYAQLQNVAGGMLRAQLTDELVDEVIDTVAREITPYLDRESVLDGGRLDRGEPYTREGILKLLESRRKQIKARRDTLEARL